MILKEIFSITAIILTFIAFVPYVRSIQNGTTKPHVFSWVIWGSTTLVVFFAQLTDHAGVGAWPIGISGCITVVVAILAYLKRGDITITKTDRLFLCLAVSALPLWYLMSDPLWAVVILTFVDLLGFGPTIRKVYDAPYSEPLLFIFLFFLRNLLVICALEHYSWTTLLFPVLIAVACLLLICLMLIRRKSLSNKSPYSR
jgi:hypothetical protein